jgi:hypothetical protein
MMNDPGQYVLYSGGANGAEAAFGEEAEKFGISEVNFTFEGHQIARTRGVRVLTPEELALKDISMTYVSRLMHRTYSSAPTFRKVLQSICWQVASSGDVFVVGSILPDLTVKGGTGWGAEYAKICNKSLHVFDQEKDAWFRWSKDQWAPEAAPAISQTHFTGTGSRFLEANGRKAIAELFARTFKK